MAQCVIQLFNTHCGTILTTLSQKTDKYTSPQIQNEILKVFSLRILKSIATSIQETKYFSVMADEVTDSSNKEQFSICFRSVDDSFRPSK